MPPSRTNENQQPNQGSLRRPINSHRGAESGRPESNVRDVKPDIGGDVKPDIGDLRDVKPDIGGGQGGQETVDGRSMMGVAPDYPVYAAHTGTTPQTLGTRPNNTIQPSFQPQPVLNLRTQNPYQPISPVDHWRHQHGLSNHVSLNSPPTTTPNSASNSRTRPPQSHDPRLPLYPDIPTPGMARPRNRDRGAQPSDGPPKRQLPSFQSSSSLRPSVNNDTPTSGEESGLDDQLHSPNYGADDSPTVPRTSHPGVPLTAADPAIHSAGPMNPPSSTIGSNQRRATLAGQGRAQPYPPSPLSQGTARMHRAVATARAAPSQAPRPPINGNRLGYADRAALGNGRPGGINGPTRAPRRSDTETLIGTLIAAGRPVPSVLEPADTATLTFTAIPSGPNTPAGQFPPAAGAPATPLATFPGESYTPQVYVPGNTHAQTPTAVPSGTPAIGPDGQVWTGYSLPRFYAEQVGQPATPGVVSEIARRLEQVRMGTPLAQAQPPRIPVPTPGDFANRIRTQAVAAITQMAKDEEAANFADPEHFDIFLKYADIALGDGTTCEILSRNIEKIVSRFTKAMEGRAAYLCRSGQPIPAEILTSLERAHALAVRLWGVNACMTEVFRLEWENVQGYRAIQIAEAMQAEAMEH